LKRKHDKLSFKYQQCALRIEHVQYLQVIQTLIFRTVSKITRHLKFTLNTCNQYVIF
jgi:hypothetical protein